MTIQGSQRNKVYGQPLGERFRGKEKKKAKM